MKNKYKGLSLLLSKRLRGIVSLMALCLLLHGCVYRPYAEPGPPSNWAFFVDISIEERPYFSTKPVPSFVEDMKAILLEKYDYDMDKIHVFKSVEELRLDLHGKDLGLKLKTGGSVFVYFYRSIEPDFLKVYFALPALYDTSETFYPEFIVIAELERISKSNMFAVFDGCSEGLGSAFEARIQEFKDLFNQRGRIEILADCGFKLEPAQYRERIAHGFDNEAIEPSGVLIGEKLAKWVYTDQKADIGKSFFSSRPRASSSQPRDSFEWIPSFSQLIERMLTIDEVKKQHSTASLIQRQLNLETRTQSIQIRATDLEGLWDIVGREDRDFRSREILMRTLTEADEAKAVARLSEFITDQYPIEIRVAATGNLALIRKPEALKLQIEQLSNDDLQIREAALSALKTWSHAPESAKGLFEKAFALLDEDKDHSYKLRLIRTLVEAETKQETPGAVFNRDILGQKLLEIVKNGSPDLRREVVFALRDIKYEPAATTLFGIFLDTNDEEIVRTAAAYSIGEVAEDLSKSDLRLIEEIIKGEEKASIRAGAAYLLGQFHDEESVKTLIIVSKEDPSDRVKLAAIDALSSVKNVEVTNALITASKDPNQQVRLKALNAIGKQEPTTLIIQRLTEIADSGLDKSTKELASKLLEKAGLTFTELIETIHDEKASAEEIINAVEYLGALVRTGVIKDKDDLMKIRDTVFKLFVKTDWSIRTAAISTLEAFPDSLIKQRAEQLLTDPYAVTRATAVRFVSRKGYVENLDTVLNMLSNDDQISVRIEAARALANPYFAEKNEDLVIEQLVNVSAEDPDKLLQNAAVGSAVQLLAAFEMKVTASEVSEDILALVDKTIKAFRQSVSSYSFYRTLSLLVGGRFYGKSAEASGDENQNEILQTAVSYYLLAAKSVPQIQPKDISVESGDFVLTVLSRLDYLFQAMKDVYFDRTAIYTLPGANLLECTEIIRAAILVELAELYADTNRLNEAINIYEGLIGRLSQSTLNQSIVYSKILVKFSQVLLNAREFGKTADIASLALHKMTLPHQLRSELLIDEQAQLLDLIDNLSEHNDSVIQNKESQGYYQTVEDNLRRLCQAAKVQRKYCDKLMMKDITE
jgi:HEAT repeat protein